MFLYARPNRTLLHASCVTLIVNDVHFHWLWIRFIDTLILHLKHNLGILYRWLYARLQGCSISIANALVLLQYCTKPSITMGSPQHVTHFLHQYVRLPKRHGNEIYQWVCVYLRNSFNLDIYVYQIRTSIACSIVLFQPVVTWWWMLTVVQIIIIIICCYSYFNFLIAIFVHWV